MMWALLPMQYRVLAAGLLLALWSGFMVYGGWHECAIREQAKQREQAIAYADAVKQEQRRGNQIAANLETEKARQKVVYRTITREVKNYVTGLSNNRCIVPTGFVLLHNAAASNRTPEPAGGIVDAPSGIALADVAQTIVDNYTDCHEWRSQLNALIDWEEGK